YHASAMVVMLRSVGVPSRLAVGYVLRPTGDEADLFRHQVTERSAFAWPEVYFPGLGWVEFNPTPNQPPVQRPGGEEATSSGPSDSDAPPVDLNLEGLAELFPEEGAPGAGAALLTDDAGDRGRWLLIGVMSGLAVLAALAAGGVTAAWLRGTAGLEPAARPWAKTVRLASWARLPQAPSQTPHEFARELRERVTGTDDAERLASAYVRYRFGGEQQDEQEQARLENAWRTVRGRLLRRLFRLGR
ncbi:MAG: transglutaminase domain-containing protein, partial [Dehalococcoidia bacterium]|nr:transglutaminase domain-containing protein [Dehalococcoidia bacterium]